MNKFVRELKDITGLEKGAISFECETSRAASKVTWLKGVKEIRAGGKYQMTQKQGILILTVKDLVEADSDMYSCSIDTAKSTAKLTVQGKSLNRRKTWQTTCGIRSLVNTISYKYRLKICLRYLGTGDSFTTRRNMSKFEPNQICFYYPIIFNPFLVTFSVVELL